MFLNSALGTISGDYQVGGAMLAKEPRSNCSYGLESFKLHKVLRCTNLGDTMNQIRFTCDNFSSDAYNVATAGHGTQASQEQRVGKKLAS
jgi:hypothetical protein